MPLEILIARPEHQKEWARLRHSLWPECPQDRHELEIEQLLAGEGIVALARFGTILVGFAEVSIRHDHVEGTGAAPVPYLEGWFVKDEFRGKGIGRALLKFVEGWAMKKGFTELASDAELHNVESIRLHKQLGFVEVGRSVHFVKALRADDHPSGSGSNHASN